jgi:hypothetical protein
VLAVLAAIRKASRRRIDRDIRGHVDFTTEESRAALERIYRKSH